MLCNIKYIGEIMLRGDTQICDCKRVKLEEIVRVIKKYNLKSVDDITEYTEAGCCCKACVCEEEEEGRVTYLKDILKDTQDGEYDYL
jgi:NifU-like protein